MSPGENMTAQRTQRFDFDHPMFRLDGWFERSSDGSGPAFRVRLDGLSVSLPFDYLRRRGARPGTSDADLLDLIEQALDFAPRIRPGDPVPTELIDGTASFQIPPALGEFTRLRFTLEVAGAIDGGSKLSPGRDLAALVEKARRPEIQQAMQRAFRAAAARVGIPEGRPLGVVDRVDQIAGELAFVEGLREPFEAVRGIEAACRTFARQYRIDRAGLEEVTRVLSLVRPPVAAMEARFAACDGLAANLDPALRDVDGAVRAIRNARDFLRKNLVLWAELIEEWRRQADRREALIRAAYRFLARHYPQGMVWAKGDDAGRQRVQRAIHLGPSADVEAAIAAAIAELDAAAFEPRHAPTSEGALR